jgi:tRNA pseudouridine38-40 synthase
MTIAYDGSRYHGWQYQPGLPTVEGELRRVLSPITQTAATFTAASRTDAGVHARGQVAGFRTASTIDLGRLRRAANSRLDADIIIRHIAEAPERFHATRNVLGKHYRYALWADAEKPPFSVAPFAYHFHRPFDLDRAASAALVLVGRHDFKSFETTGGEPRLTTVRTIHRLQVRRQGPHVWFDIEGDGFLYNMVRNMVGTLLEIARGRWASEDMPAILAACDRTAAGPTAPPQGLTLVQVFYDEARIADMALPL